MSMWQFVLGAALLVALVLWAFRGDETSAPHERKTPPDVDVK